MTWWDSASLSTDNNTANQPEGSLATITCVPVQHHTQRTLFDKDTSLWCGFVIATPKKSVCFIGDTGYCQAFREIGTQLGPFDLSLLPIGSYEPRESMKFQHCSPDEAVVIHSDLGSKLSVAIHHGTLQYSMEPVCEPPLRLAKGLSTHNIPTDRFRCIPHGASIEV
eukprot:c17291_g1_i5.p1 GENE.c17291_g1_i5~~c17291_g1_i5.p1  ORF type:complete len:167 (+),score=27.87 c17291_g1_i5:639-1139(+)